MTHTQPTEFMTDSTVDSEPNAPKNSTAVQASVIWLHGLGADGHDFVPVAKELNLAQVRFIFPHAPDKPVTINNGYVMPAWYDLFGLTLGSNEDETGIRLTQTYIETLIDQEIARGVPANRIVLAGFSQGGAMALHTALRYPKALAGVMALSTYLPLKGLLSAEAHPANADTPILMAHGTQDEVIHLTTAEVSLNILNNAGYAVEFKPYAMAHSVCFEEINDIRAFLQRVLVE